MMNYENWISYRYLTKSQGRFLSFLNIMTIIGVAIGVMALIVVIGVMTGFGNNLRDKIIGTTPHIMIEKETGIRDYRGLIEQIVPMEGVERASPYVQGNVFIESSGQALGVVARGLDTSSDHQTADLSKYLIQGHFNDLQGDTIIIGKELARYYGFNVGEQLTLIAPSSGMAGEGWKYQLTIVGIFNTGMADYDMSLILVPLRKAQELFHITDDRVSGIGIKLRDPYSAKDIKQKIYEKVGYSFLVRSWIDINRNLFEALFLEKWGLFIVLTLMVLVASFNIVSTLVVTVTSKIHDIGVLKSIGVPKSAIRRIFTRQGLFIGSLGIFWGIVSGLGVSYMLANYFEVPPDIYSIEHVPVEIQMSDVLIIVTAAMVISFLASIYPAAKAANLQPVDALRYE